MGSWSETIMGGDGPMDAEYEILRHVGFDDQEGARDHTERLPEVKRLLEQVSDDRWLPFFEEGWSDSWSDDKRRVAALLFMECGASMPEVVKTEALRACEDDVDDWRDPERRQFHLDELAKAIKEYDGTPVSLPSEGLFDKIMEGEFPNQGSGPTFR